MGPLKTKQLKTELARVRQKGNHKQALALLRALEEAEPREGSWPHRASEIHRKCGDAELEVAALLRAAERFRSSGFLLKAIAVCKRVLEIDAEHGGAREILAALCEQRGVPDGPRPPCEDGADAQDCAAPPGAVERVPPPDALDALRGSHAESAPGAAPLEPGSGDESPEDDTFSELVLTQIIESSPPTLLGEVSEGLAEISLESADGERARSPVDAAVEQLLPHTELFSSLPPSQLAQLIAGSEVVRVAEGEVIFHEGDPGEAVFVIVEGAVTLVCDGPIRRMVAALAEGEFFGESAFMRSHPRNATARAVVDTILIRIDEKVVRRLIAHSPQVLVVLLSFLRDRLIQRLMRTSPLFERLGRTEQLCLARSFRFVEAVAGSTLIHRGRPPSALFLVLSGSLEVRTEPGTEPLAHLEPGDVFGEMSLVTGEPAMASVIAREVCWLLFLPKQDVDALLSDPRIRSRIDAIVRDRQRHNAALGTGLDHSLGLE